MEKHSMKKKKMCGNNKPFEITYIGKPIITGQDRVGFSRKQYSATLSEIVSNIANSSTRHNYIDYVLIDGFNDDEEMFRCFAEAVEPIAERVRVRVSTAQKSDALSEKLSLTKVHFSEILSEYGISHKSVISM